MIYEDSDNLGYFSFDPDPSRDFVKRSGLSYYEWLMIEAAANLEFAGLTDSAAKCRAKAGYH